MSLRDFVFRILFAMPLCFGIWYFSAAVWIWFIAELTHGVLRLLFSRLIASVGSIGHTLDIVTNLGDIEQYTQHHKMMALVFSINPLQYGYSLAVYSALLLASKNYHWRAWLVGLAVLMGAIVLGVCFDVLKTIAFDLAPTGTTYPTGFSDWQLNMLGVAYQLGYLVLPTVLPLILWANFNQLFFRSYLAGSVADIQQD
ncbi:MAG: exosortase H-associated membrane protein [Methylococcales bacterium]